MIKSFATLISALALAAGPALAQGGFLGIALEPAPDGTAGVRIATVQERSAAAIMGLRVGDFVTAVDGQACADPAALTALISSRDPGDIVELDVLRDGASQKVLGVLARRPGVRSVRLPGQPGRVELNQEQRQQLQELQPMLQDLQPLMLDLEPQLQGLRLRLNDLDLDRSKLLDEVREQLQQLEKLDLQIDPNAQGFAFRWGGEPGQVFLQPGEPLRADANTKIQLRYPESTLPEERDRLRKEAVEKYGEEVVVEFSGNGTSISIQRQTVGTPGAPGAPAVPTVPPASGKNREF